jgi:hypothetical protein
MTFKEFYSWFLVSSITLLVMVLGYFGTESLDELRNIRKEMTDLNIKLVVVVTHQANQEAQIGDLKMRVEKLEEKF